MPPLPSSRWIRYRSAVPAWRRSAVRATDDPENGHSTLQPPAGEGQPAGVRGEAG
jgi:hypothetical protein